MVDAEFVRSVLEPELNRLRLALHSCREEAAKDYRDMRRMQANFICADSHLRHVIRVVKDFIDGRATETQVRVAIKEAESR